jgi:hypothetical protein
VPRTDTTDRQVAGRESQTPVWRREIVAPGDTEIQKFAGHSDTNDVRTDVFIARVAAAVAIKACSRSLRYNDCSGAPSTFLGIPSESLCMALCY